MAARGFGGFSGGAPLGCRQALPRLNGLPVALKATSDLSADLVTPDPASPCWCYWHAELGVNVRPPC